jgi:hypothetical protein
MKGGVMAKRKLLQEEVERFIEDVDGFREEFYEMFNELINKHLVRYRGTMFDKKAVKALVNSNPEYANHEGRLYDAVNYLAGIPITVWDTFHELFPTKPIFKLIPIV